MTVFPPDQRRIIQPNDPEFTDFPFPAVAAIDTQIGINEGNITTNFVGSGITITPNHILTAAHVVFDDENPNTIPLRARATTSAKQKDLVSRIIQNPADANVQNRNINFLANDFRQTNEEEDDIALLTTNQPLLPVNEVVPLTAFVNPQDAIDLTVETAGYPEDNVSEPILDHDGQPGSGQPGRDLVVAPGFNFPLGTVQSTQSPRLFFLSNNVDLYNGQSGSGVWHEYDDDLRIIGLFNFDDPVEGNGGILFTTDLYNEIIELTKDTSSVDGNDLPENAIIGTDPSFIPIDTPFSTNGNDEIIGTYRRERIIGNGGDDNLDGGGADDRLEGGEGNDILDGGAGNDLAIFSDNFENYEYSIPLKE